MLRWVYGGERQAAGLQRFLLRLLAAKYCTRTPIDTSRGEYGARADG
jgi:hypothetical protein